MINVVRVVCLVAGMISFLFGSSGKQETRDKIVNLVFSVIFFFIALLGERVWMLL